MSPVASDSALPPPIASLRVYAGVLGATATVAALALAGVPLGGRTGWAFLGAAVLLTGMPHGAVDHLVVRRLFDLRGARGVALFYIGYLALAVLYGVGWWIWPKGALALFLGMAAYHFGQADMAHLAPRSARRRIPLYLSRGLFVVGSPLLAHPAAVGPLVEALAGVSLSAASGLPGWWPLVSVAALAGQHAIALRMGAKDAAGRWREGPTVAVLAVLFVAAPPLPAFAVYFGLWHALGHIFVLMRFFAAAPPSPLGPDASSDPGAPPGSERPLRAPQTMRAFYRAAALYTLLPLVALVAVLLLLGPRASLPGAADTLAALFVLISVLTLPHMLLVERLYRHERRRLGRQHT